MSLIGLDGTAFTFNANDTAYQLNASQNDFIPISTRNAFQFDRQPSGSGGSMQMDDASAASASATAPSGPLFAAPLHPAMPISFAASNPQRPAAGASTVQLDFSEFEAEIATMEHAKRQEFQETLALHARKIAEEKDGTAALPSQIGDSKLFHQMVLKQYGKVHHLNEDPKRVFQTRKANKRDARKQKKAEDKADQMEAKTGGAMRKNKHKNRSKGQY